MLLCLSRGENKPCAEPGAGLGDSFGGLQFRVFYFFYEVQKNLWSFQGGRHNSWKL